MNAWMRTVVAMPPLETWPGVAVREAMEGAGLVGWLERVYSTLCARTSKAEGCTRRSWATPPWSASSTQRVSRVPWLNRLESVSARIMPAGQYTIKIIQVAEKKAIVCHTKKELTVSQFQ